MRTGRYGAWFSTVAGQMLTWHHAWPLQMMHGLLTHSAADIVRELDIHWVVHRIVQDQLDYGVSKNSTDDDKAHCMDLSCIHWIRYTDQRQLFWS